ncbi:hypothetical protein H5410_003045 [Solanum commersonii]|uniref:Uncharacterized protein n=1 Tax=Solanum commersonii TaxID=4109 RepID=A0A9J6B3Y6_SOLCO|nr:hypothetical protein H5410_003045 [Solanum commersonii]
MLAQEIIHQINKPNIESNVIIKLDMAKNIIGSLGPIYAWCERSVGSLSRTPQQSKLLWILHGTKNFKRLEASLTTTKATSRSILVPLSLRDRIEGSGLRRRRRPSHLPWLPLYLLVDQGLFILTLLTKFCVEITGWQTKLLSNGGRAILVKHVLQSLPIYLL